MKVVRSISGLIIIILILSSCNKNKADCIMGTPDPLAICTADYTPVCGCNKVTYANACSAEVAGVPSYTQGECP